MIPTEPKHHGGLLNFGVMDDEKYKSMLIDGGPLWGKIYKRSVIFGNEEFNKDCKVFPEDIYYEDNAIFASLYLKIKRFVYLPEPMYFYYQRQGSQVHHFNGKQLLDRWQTSHMILELAQKEGNLKKFFTEFEFLFTQIFYVNSLYQMMPYEFIEKKDFSKSLALEQKNLFPNFRNNPYYPKRIDPFTRGMVNLIMDIFTGN